MAELPRGTVTFLFTDIEGSTRLLKELGDRYADVLETHARILRETAGEHEGREVDNQGDSFFFVFARANAALAAAVVAQRALAAHEWPDGVDVRVRMGLHTGEPVVGEERYVGLGVHRAARIGAVAHGGQVLLSSATRELVEEKVGGVSVRELGSYRLKDIDLPERLYQLDIEGLRSQFPPLKVEKVVSPGSLRRRRVLLSGLAGVIAAAVAIPIFAFGQGGGGGETLSAATGNSLGIVDSGSGRLVGDVPVGTTPAHVAVGEGAIWVTNTDGDSVSKIDSTTQAVVDTIPNVGSGPSGIAVGGGAVWVVNSLDGKVSRIDPKTDTVVQSIDVGNDPGGIVYGAGSVWVANSGDGTITRIDASRGTPSKPLGVAATELVFGGGALWASERAQNQVVRIDPKSGEVVEPITVGNGPTGIAFGAGSVWVANSLDGTVTRIDPNTNTVTHVIPTGNGPTAVAADARGVWVSNQYDGTLVRIDPSTSRPGPPIHVGNRLQGVAIADADVLVSVDTESGAAHHGGTLIARMSGLIDSIDTAVAYSTSTWPLLRMTGDGLVAFDQTSGLAGTQLVPDLAVSLPAPTDGGKTYTFRLRANIRYSNGANVKASDVRATFERDFRLGKLQATFYDGIVGGARCEKEPKHCSFARGIVANDAPGTVTFHLIAPDSEFLYKLALPFAYVAPAGTPAREVTRRSLPATGPYTISRYDPTHVLRLVRNRYFHEWSKAAQPDGYPNEIVVRLGGTGDALVDDVIRGKADIASTLWSTNPSRGRLQAIKTRYAGQVHANPEPGTNGLFLNTRLSPFDSVDVRRALNYAIDRGAVVQFAGGPDLAVPTCQILPPNFPGYRPYCPYTAGSTTRGVWTAPNLATARALVARSGTRGMKITVVTTPFVRFTGTVTVKALRSLGYRVSIKSIANNDYFGYVSDSRSRAQIGFTGWTADYPAASDFLTNLFTCASFVPGSQNNSNFSGFCDSHIDRQIANALTEQATNPQAAAGLWGGIDRQIVDEAPWIPLVNPKIVDVVSKRVGDYQYSANGFGVLIDQLWVR